MLVPGGDFGVLVGRVVVATNWLLATLSELLSVMTMRLSVRKALGFDLAANSLCSIVVSIDSQVGGYSSVGRGSRSQIVWEIVDSKGLMRTKRDTSLRLRSIQLEATPAPMDLDGPNFRHRYRLGYRR